MTDLQTRLRILESAADDAEPAASVAVFLCQNEHPTTDEREAAHAKHPDRETIFVGRVDARTRSIPHEGTNHD